MAAATILVIEGDDAVRAHLGTLLSDEGFQVALAADGREAMSLLKGTQPSLILLAMLLPNEDGWSFMTKRRRNPDLAAVPVIIVTGLTIASDEWARSLGAVALLRKPVDPARLLELVQRYCSA